MGNQAPRCVATCNPTCCAQCLHGEEQEKSQIIFANASSVLFLAADDIMTDDHLEKELANEVELWRMDVTTSPDVIGDIRIVLPFGDNLSFDRTGVDPDDEIWGQLRGNTPELGCAGDATAEPVAAVLTNAGTLLLGGAGQGERTEAAVAPRIDARPKPPQLDNKPSGRDNSDGGPSSSGLTADDGASMDSLTGDEDDSHFGGFIEDAEDRAATKVQSVEIWVGDGFVALT